MASIASLAIKISADIGDMTKNVSNVVSSIDNISKVAGKATPSMKNLEDAAKGYSIMLDAVTAAEQRVNDVRTNDYGHAIEMMNETISTTETLKEKVQNFGSVISDDILNMNPTIKNVMAAQKEVEKLKAIATATGIDMSGSIAQAEASLGKLTNSAVQSQVAMQSFKAVVFSFQNMPFLILMEVLKEIAGWVKDIASTWDAKLNGIPSVILKTGTVLLAVVTLVGILNSEMLGVAASTTYWQTLVKSNVIYIGLCTIATAAWTAAQWVLNVAMTANPIGLIVAAIAIAVALVAGLVLAVRAAWQWWWNSADAVDTAAQKTQMLKDASEAYKNTLKDTVDEHKKMLDVITKISEAAKSPAQKAADRAGELQNAIDEPKRLQERIATLNNEIQNRKKLIANITDNEQIESLKQRNEEAVKTLNDLRNIQSQMKPLTDMEIAAQQAANTKAEMDDRDVSKYLPKISAGEELARARSEIAAMFDSGKIDALKRNAMLQNAQNVFEQNDEAFQAIKKQNEETLKAAQKKAEEAQALAGKFAHEAQTPIEAFYNLSEQLDSVRENLKPDEVAAAQQKLLDDLAKNLDVAKYLQPADSLQSQQEKLAGVYEKLIQYANASNMTDEQLIEAKQKAVRDILGQSEYAKMLYDARPAFEKIKEAQEKIIATALALEANGENITQEVLDKALANAEEKFKDKDVKKTKAVATNAALERGTMAYYEAQRRGDDPLLKEQQRQTKLQQQTAENTKKMAEKAEKTTSDYEFVFTS